MLENILRPAGLTIKKQQKKKNTEKQTPSLARDDHHGNKAPFDRAIFY